MFFKIGVPKTLAIFTGKHLWRSRFLIKMKAFRNASLLKRDSGKDVFLWISRIFKNNVFYRTSQVAASANIRIIGGVARTPPKKNISDRELCCKALYLTCLWRSWLHFCWSLQYKKTVFKILSMKWSTFISWAKQQTPVL